MDELVDVILGKCHAIFHDLSLQEKFVHRLDKALVGEGLYQIVGHAKMQSLADMFGIVGCSDHDHVFFAVLPAQLGKKLQAGNIRHIKIEQ